MRYITIGPYDPPINEKRARDLLGVSSKDLKILTDRGILIKEKRGKKFLFEVNALKKYGLEITKRRRDLRKRMIKNALIKKKEDKIYTYRKLIAKKRKKEQDDKKFLTYELHEEKNVKETNTVLEIKYLETIPSNEVQFDIELSTKEKCDIIKSVDKKNKKLKEYLKPFFLRFPY